MTDPFANHKARYTAAAHAVQCGTKALAGLDPNFAGKAYSDLRTGLNVQMAEYSGLCMLLVEKGVITEAEFAEATCAALEREKARMEAEYEATTGAKVTFV